MCFSRFLILTIICLLGWTFISFAEEPRFQTTAKGIVEVLTKRTPQKYAKTRSFQAPQKSRVRQIEVSTQERGIIISKKILISDDPKAPSANLRIEFDVNAYAIRPTSYSLLNELGNALSSPKLKDVPIFINGHTDSDGETAYNLKLSLNRALAVKSYLVGQFSIPDSRLKVTGYGEAMPLVPNDSPENKQINRRVEIQAQNGE